MRQLPCQEELALTSELLDEPLREQLEAFIAIDGDVKATLRQAASLQDATPQALLLASQARWLERPWLCCRGRCLSSRWACGLFSRL